MTLPMEKGSETYKQVGTGLGFPKKILKDLWSYLDLWTYTFRIKLMMKEMLATNNQGDWEEPIYKEIMS